MTTALTKLHQKTEIAAFSMNENELMEVLRSSLYPGAAEPSVKLVLNYCKAAGLDPMQKPVHIVPMSVKAGKNPDQSDRYEMRDVIMPGVGLYRTQAARTQQLAGISEPEFGPIKSLPFREEIWEDGENGKRRKRFADASMEYPEWCKVTVMRQLQGGSIAEFTAVEYWIENYATRGRDSTAPNAMWRKRPRGQLAKCTQAQALRQAFPEMTGSAPTADEMEGRNVDDLGVVIDGASGEVIQGGSIKMPQPKAPSDASNKIDSSQKPPASTEPDRSATVAAGAGQLSLIRKKAEQAGISEEALCQKYAIDKLDGISVAKGNEILNGLRSGA